MLVRSTTKRNTPGIQIARRPTTTPEFQSSPSAGMNLTKVRRAVGAILVLLVLYLNGSPPVWATSDVYLLGPGDRIRISVFGRPDLSGAYTVSPSGTISMPLLGRFEVSGLDLVRAEKEVASAYEQRLATDSPLAPSFSVNIEIAEYRPFYVLGDVDKPGSYPYQSDLTVLRALALAGGRLSSRNGTRFSPIDYSREEETLAALVDSYLNDVVREARLLSERDSFAEVQLPADILARIQNSRIQQIVSDEVQLFRTRSEMVDGQVGLLSARIGEYGNEISELEQEKEALERKRSLIEQRLVAFRTMVERGVGARLDLLQLEINAIEAEREIRQNSVLLLNARLGTNQAEQGLDNLRSQTARTIVAELAAVRMQLSQTLIHIQKSSERLAIMGGAVDGVEMNEGEARYVIRRLDGGTYKEIPAGPDTPVYPADTVIIPAPTTQPISPGGISLPKRLDDLRIH